MIKIDQNCQNATGSRLSFTPVVQKNCIYQDNPIVRQRLKDIFKTRYDGCPVQTLILHTDVSFMFPKASEWNVRKMGESIHKIWSYNYSKLNAEHNHTYSIWYIIWYRTLMKANPSISNPLEGNCHHHKPCQILPQIHRVLPDSI